MPSPVVETTLQAALLSGLSNILAQAITAYQSGKSFAPDPVPVGQFMLWTLISTPPNVYWQSFLEEMYPSETTDQKGQRRLSKLNTVKKFILDQMVGAPINSVAFIAGINTLKGQPTAQIQRAVQTDFWPLMRSGWKVWPLVSVLSFSLVPANKRILFRNVVGLFWGIYLSLLAAY